MVGGGTARRITVLVIVLAVIVGVVIVFLVRTKAIASPECTAPGATPGAPSVSVSPEQADNAATITAVGLRLGMPDHAVTVALATALQESKLTNLTGGDRDSAGLFQQRPSQGWGTYAQVTDPVHAATAFYDHLRKIDGWRTLSVTEAAQDVQHSAAGDAYAQWEPQARALAVALTGETPAAFTCQHLKVTATGASLATAAAAEWGTTRVTGPHDANRGWAMAYWLVANAMSFGVDQVSFAGRTWTAASGTWSQPAGSGAGTLSLHQVTAANG